MNTATMRASLIAVALLTAGLGGSLALSTQAAKGDAGTAASAPKAGHMFGIVIGRDGDKTYTVKPDDPNEATLTFSKPADKDLAKIWPSIFPDHAVEVKYNLVAGQPVLTSLKLLSFTSGKGKAAGTVTDKVTTEGQWCWIEVKDGKNPTLRFVPYWDPKTKGPNKDVVAQIAAANVGDKVTVDWAADGERLHLLGVQVVAKAKPTSKPAAGQ